ncbi:hypothetical protein [Microbacterium sp. LMI1-1-1.1]|uniref:hypothetical protein n=1 Tax=Microbacterium sp. LMI1-1-1.1 TaxID=3135223 RepID=UPI00346744E6
MSDAPVLPRDAVRIMALGELLVRVLGRILHMGICNTRFRLLRRARVVLLAVSLAAGSLLFTAPAAYAGDCRGIFCGRITNANDSRYTILIGADWDASQGRPTGSTRNLRPGESSSDFIRDVDGYLLVRGVCAWFYGSGGTTQAKNYITGDGKWHKINDTFNYTLHTYKC